MSKNSAYAHSLISQKTAHHPVELRIHSGIAELDHLLGGFLANTITFLQADSKYLSKISNQLCVQTYRTFSSTSLFVDAGACIDPYKIAHYAKQLEEDSREVLKHVLVSRTFTLYQLQAFVLHDLEILLEKHAPRTLILGGFPQLFSDLDIPKDERHTILLNILKKIRILCEHYDLIMMLTTTTRHCAGWLRTTIEDCCDETLRFRTLDKCTYIDAVKKQIGTVILHLGKGQLRLEHFGLVV